MGKFVPYALAYSLEDEWWLYDVYHAEGSPLKSPLSSSTFQTTKGIAPFSSAWQQPRWCTATTRMKS